MALSNIDKSIKVVVRLPAARTGLARTQCRPEVAIPSCQALAPAAVAAFAWASLRFTTALGGSCWARIQRLMPLTTAVPVTAMPHMPITPAVATRANPTIMALDVAVLGCMSVIDDLVLVIVSPDVVLLS